ncbi:MAG: hypothetical protein ACRDTH_09045 [Pseudonocardiaceae bacterium]
MYATVSGNPSGSVHPIAGWARWPIFTLALVVSAVILSLYATVLLGAVTKVFGVDYELTFSHLREVLFGAGQEAVIDTTIVAAIATPVAGLAGMVIAWLVVRHLRTSAPWLDFAATLGIAVPGTVLGIGYVLAYRTDTTIGGVTVLPALVGGTAIFGGALTTDATVSRSPIAWCSR